MRDNAGVRGFLEAYLSQLKPLHAAELTATLYVADEERIKQVSFLKRDGSKLRDFSDEEGRWKLPSGLLLETLRKGDIQLSADSKSACVPIFPLGGPTTICVGLLSIVSTKNLNEHAKDSDEHKVNLSLQTDTLNAGRAAFETLRLQMSLEWQQGILDTLQRISDLEYVDHGPDWRFPPLVRAALSIAPMACVGHIFAVKYDERRERPITLSLKCACESEKTPPTLTPTLLGTFTDANPYEYSVYDGVAGRCVIDREKKYVNDLEDAKPYHELYKRSRSEICYPLIVGEQVVGVLNLESESPSAFSESDQKNLQILAHMAALILFAGNNVQARINTYERGLTTLHTVLHSSHSPKALIESIVVWSREIAIPPYDFASFVPNESAYDLKPAQSGVRPSTNSGLDLTLILEHGGTTYGTLMLLTSSRHTTVAQGTSASTLDSFNSALSAAIHASLALAHKRDQAILLQAAIRHTIRDLKGAIEDDMATMSDEMKAAYYLGALEYVHVICDIFAHGMEGAGSSSLDSTRTDVALAMQAVERAMKWRFLASGIDFQVAYLPTNQRNPSLEGHHSTLKWALIELLQNARKFSEAGNRTRVRMSLKRPRPSGDHFEIWVEDDCEIIPLEDRTKVFERFVTLPRAGTSVSGTGLGLYTVHVCVVDDLHGTHDIDESQTLSGNRFKLGFTAADSDQG